MKNPLNHAADLRKNKISRTQLSLAQPVNISQEQEDKNYPQQVIKFLQRRGLVMLGVATAVTTVVTAYTFSQKAVYQSNFLMLVEPLNNNDSWKKIAAPVDPSLAQDGLDYDSQILVLKSPEQMKVIVQNLQAKYPDINYNSLINSLKILRYGRTKVINVSYSNQDPYKIKVVLDEIAQDFLRYSLQQRQTKLRQGTQFVEQQLPAAKERVDKLQKELQIFRRRNHAFNPELQAQEISAQVSKLSEERLGINRELATVRTNFDNLQADTGKLAALNNATLYQQLLTQLRQIDAQIATESARFQSASPNMELLEDKRKNLVPLLQKEAQRILGVQLASIASQKQVLEMQSQEVAKVEQQLQQTRDELPSLARKYTELQQDLLIATDSLKRFLITRESLQVEIAQTELPWQLIQAPVQPIIPISPNIIRNLLLGLLGGIVLGIGTALVLENLDNTYHTVENLKQKLKRPLLGTIPVEKQLQNRQHSTNNKEGSKLGVKKLGRSNTVFVQNEHDESVSDNEQQVESLQFWDAFGMVLNNIQMLSDQSVRSIVISSSQPGEGKSTIAYYLAQMATTLGQKVLLVDTDMRRPQIHHLANMNNLWGLSSLISGNLSVEQAIRELPSMSGCSVITAGSKPPDTVKLISSDKMKQLIEQFEQDFDLVIYDAPPLIGMADATVLATNTDGMIVVVRMDKTEKSALTRAMDNLKMSRINVLGVIANGDNSKFRGYHNYYK